MGRKTFEADISANSGCSDW